MQVRETLTANPSINTDWRNKAAPAGYVKRYGFGDSMAKTHSESLFEAYCKRQKIRCRPVAVGASRTPDYDVFLRRFKVVTEVKELAANPHEKQAEEDLRRQSFTVHSSVPGDRVRKKITDAMPQIRARARGRFPGLLVLFATGFYVDHISPYNIRVALYGFETIVFTIPNDARASPYVTDRKFGGSRKVSEEHNTSLSAVAALTAHGDDNLELTVFHNRYAARPLNRSLFAHYGVTQYELGAVQPGAVPQWVEV